MANKLREEFEKETGQDIRFKTSEMGCLEYYKLYSTWLEERINSEESSWAKVNKLVAEVNDKINSLNKKR